jgi:hypothetical protein
MWSIPLAFRLLVSCRIFLYSLALSNIHFLHDRSSWSSPSFFSTTYQLYMFNVRGRKHCDKTVLGPGQGRMVLHRLLGAVIMETQQNYNYRRSRSREGTLVDIQRLICCWSLCLLRHYEAILGLVRRYTVSQDGFQGKTGESGQDSFPSRWIPALPPTKKTPCTYNVSARGKAILLYAWTGPEGPRSLTFPDFMIIDIWRWHGCQPYAPAAFTPGNIPGTHFC